MSGAHDHLEDLLEKRLAELDKEADVHVHHVDDDAERLAEARASPAYWFGRCPGRWYEAQREIEALANLCSRPPNRRLLRKWSIRDEASGPRVDVTYLVWRE